jgi:hypothetical protein
MRALQYLAFAIAFVGAQACAAEDKTPPPLHSGAPEQAGQASTDGDNGIDGTDESSDPGQDEDLPLAPGSGPTLDPAACSVTYTKHILPKIRDQWRCGAGGCHSSPLATGAKTVMDTTNADATYTLLTSTVHAGKKLVDTTSVSPTDSALYCLMQGTCGQRMPRQGVDPADLVLVASWLKCKAPRGTAD